MPAFSGGVPPTPSGEPMSCRHAASAANQSPGLHVCSEFKTGTEAGLNATLIMPAVGSVPVPAVAWIVTMGISMPP